MSPNVYGINPTGTIDLLKKRAALIKQGRKPADGRKVALIVEGGAMRGVISCAALMGLEELGMTEAFDEVYGASAGAVNAAYFLARQAAYATTAYYQKINNTRRQLAGRGNMPRSQHRPTRHIPRRRLRSFQALQDPSKRRMKSRHALPHLQR